MMPRSPLSTPCAPISKVVVLTVLLLIRDGPRRRVLHADHRALRRADADVAGVDDRAGIQSNVAGGTRPGRDDDRAIGGGRSRAYVERTGIEGGDGGAVVAESYASTAPAAAVTLI